MINPKFTPGPWRSENTPGAGLQIFGHVPFKANCGEFTLKAAEQPLWTLLAYEQWLQFSPEAWDEMQEANAHLIAAAPDLLKACEDALETIQDWNPGAARPIETVLEQAIAKAYGKESKP